MLEKDLQLVCVGRAAPSLAAVPPGNAGASLPATEHIKQGAGRKHTYPSMQLPCCEGHPRTLFTGQTLFYGASDFKACLSFTRRKLHVRWGFSSPCVIVSVPHKPQLNEQGSAFQGRETEPFTSRSCVHLAATAESVPCKYQ